MKCQSLLFENNKKYISKCPLLKSLPSMLSVKHLTPLVVVSSDISKVVPLQQLVLAVRRWFHMWPSRKHAYIISTPLNPTFI